MDQPASITPESFATFQKAILYHTEESGSPDGSAYNTFNQFFGRRLAQPRVIDNPNESKTVVYPADSRFDAAFTIDDSDHMDLCTGQIAPPPQHLPTVQVKGIPWDIKPLLGGSDYGSAFAGGVWCYSFLCTYNYHRQHAPVSGTVVEVKVIQGGAYLEVKSENGELKRRRRMAGHSHTPSDGQVAIKAEDGAGYQFFQTRGLFVIDASTSPDGDIGLVAGRCS